MGEEVSIDDTTGNPDEDEAADLYQRECCCCSCTEERCTLFCFLPFYALYVACTRRMNFSSRVTPEDNGEIS